MCAQAGVSEDRTPDSGREPQDNWACWDAETHVCHCLFPASWFAETVDSHTKSFRQLAGIIWTRFLACAVAGYDTTHWIPSAHAARRMSVADSHLRSQAHRSWASALLHPVEQLGFGSHAWHLMSPRVSPPEMLSPLGVLHSAAEELRALLPWVNHQHGIDEHDPLVRHKSRCSQ